MDEGVSVSTTASHESFGGTPQSFPPVGFMFEPDESWYSGAPEADDEGVRVGPVTVYCGTRRAAWNLYTRVYKNASVYLNVKVYANGSFGAFLSANPGEDVSILAFEGTSKGHVIDHLAHTIALPFYN